MSYFLLRTIRYCCLLVGPWLKPTLLVLPWKQAMYVCMQGRLRMDRMEYDDNQKLVSNISITGIWSIICVNVSTLIDTPREKKCKYIMLSYNLWFRSVYVRGFVCVFVTRISLLEVILKCPWELISIAYDVCFNGPLNGYSIVINLKYEMAFVIISTRILLRTTDSRTSMCLLN